METLKAAALDRQPSTICVRGHFSMCCSCISNGTTSTNRANAPSVWSMKS